MRFEYKFSATADRTELLTVKEEEEEEGKEDYRNRGRNLLRRFYCSFYPTKAQ